MGTVHSVTRVRAEEQAERTEAERLHYWLTRCVMERKTLSFTMARAIYYHIKKTREIYIVDFRASNPGVQLRTMDGEPTENDEPVISLVSKPFPYISLSAHETLAEALACAQAIGLAPRIAIYESPKFHH